MDFNFEVKNVHSKLLEGDIIPVTPMMGPPSILFMIKDWIEWHIILPFIKSE